MMSSNCNFLKQSTDNILKGADKINWQKNIKFLIRLRRKGKV